MLAAVLLVRASNALPDKWLVGTLCVDSTDPFAISLCVDSTVPFSIS